MALKQVIEISEDEEDTLVIRLVKAYEQAFGKERSREARAYAEGLLDALITVAGKEYASEIKGKAWVITRARIVRVPQDLEG